MRSPWLVLVLAAACSRNAPEHRDERVHVTASDERPRPLAVGQWVSYGSRELRVVAAGRRGFAIEIDGETDDRVIIAEQDGFGRLRVTRQWSITDAGAVEEIPTDYDAMGETTMLGKTECSTKTHVFASCLVAEDVEREGSSEQRTTIHLHSEIPILGVVSTHEVTGPPRSPTGPKPKRRTQSSYGHSAATWGWEGAKPQFIARLPPGAADEERSKFALHDDLVAPRSGAWARYEATLGNKTTFPGAGRYEVVLQWVDAAGVGLVEERVVRPTSGYDLDKARPEAGFVLQLALGTAGFGEKNRRARARYANGRVTETDSVDDALGFFFRFRPGARAHALPREDVEVKAGRFPLAYIESAWSKERASRVAFHADVPVSAVVFAEDRQPGEDSASGLRLELVGYALEGAKSAW